MKQDFVYKLITTIDPKITDAIFETIDEQDWYVEDYRKVLKEMVSTQSIPIFHTPLCGVVGTFETFKAVRENELYNKFIDKIIPVLDVLKKHYNFNYYTAFLTRVNPKSIVTLHKDSGSFLLRCHRIHLPIQTNDKVYYHIEGYNYNWYKNCLYEFDNSLLHGVDNQSNEHRVHLIINLYNLEEHELKQLNIDKFLRYHNNEASNSPARMEH